MLTHLGREETRNRSVRISDRYVSISLRTYVSKAFTIALDRGNPVPLSAVVLLAVL